MSLTDDQTDALRELVNIGMGKSAGALSELLHSRIELGVPVVKVVPAGELLEQFRSNYPSRIASVQAAFTGRFPGIMQIIFPDESASRLMTILQEEDPSSGDWEARRSATLTEIANIVAHSVLGSVANVLDERFQLFPSTYEEDTMENVLAKSYGDPATPVLMVQTRLAVEEHEIPSLLCVLVEVVLLDTLRSALDDLCAQA